MNGAIILALLLTLMSCSSMKKKNDQVITKQEKDQVVQSVNLTIRPGEVLKVDFVVPSKGKKFKCKDKEIVYHTVDGIGEAFLVESYFSDMKPYNCFLGKTKLFDVNVVEKEFPSEKLNVDKKKVFYSKKDLKRIIKEKEHLQKVYGRFYKKPLFKKAFQTPLDSKITSIYGTKRLFNNHKQSQHLGIDYRASVGTPIKASNAGKVVVSRDLFFLGNAVIIDHGLGVFTVYGHLSKRLATEGEYIPQGALIGEAGKTGRVTGPHLHWGVKVHGNWVDGLSLVRESSDENI